MAKMVLTNMTMLEKDGRVLVIDRIKRFQGIAFPGGAKSASARTGMGMNPAIDKVFINGI